MPVRFVDADAASREKGSETYKKAQLFFERYNPDMASEIDQIYLEANGVWRDVKEKLYSRHKELFGTAAIGDIRTHELHLAGFYSSVPASRPCISFKLAEPMCI